MKSVMSVCIVLLSLLVPAQGSGQELPFDFSESKIDVGYSYVYDFSENPDIFVPQQDARFYVYIAGPAEFETVTQRNKGTQVSITRYTMNWRYVLWEKSESFSYYSDDFEFSREATHLLHTTITRDFDGAEAVFSGERIENGDPSHPVAFSGNAKLVRVPEYSVAGAWPGDLFMALRFIARPRLRRVPASRSGYSVDMNIVRRGTDEITYEGTTYICQEYSLSASGIIGTLFGKTATAWLEADSGIDYLVRFRDENQPFYEISLARRERMTPQEWGQLKDALITELKRSEE